MCRVIGKKTLHLPAHRKLCICRFMSAYEQKVEPPDRKWQYLLFAAEPYETIAFKVPSREVDKSETRFWSHWNRETKEFFLQFSFKLVDPRGGGSRAPAPTCWPARCQVREGRGYPAVASHTCSSCLVTDPYALITFQWHLIRTILEH